MRIKADSDLVRRQNRHIVLETLRSQGPMARVRLGQITGLSPATITTIAAQLIGESAVLELDEHPLHSSRNMRGRPITRIGLNPSAAYVIAMKISIGGVELALSDFSGTVIGRKSNPTVLENIDPANFGITLAEDIRNFLKDCDLSIQSLARIGIAIQGVADSREGIANWSPAFKARNVALIEPLQQELGVTCTLANDANMIAEGVVAANLQHYSGTTAVVFIGYGVGMGLIIDGKVYHGSNGAAAEFGHMNHVPNGAFCSCGTQGCIEAYASDYGILRSYKKLPVDQMPPPLPVDHQIMAEVEAAARSGDKDAVAAYQKAGQALGFGLARLVALLNPSRIVLAGPGTRALDLIEPSLRAAIESAVFDELRRDVKIESVPIHTDMIITGTIGAALRYLDSQIFAFGPMTSPTELLECVP